MFAKIIGAVFLLAAAASAADFTLKNNSPDQDVVIFVQGSVLSASFILGAGEENRLEVPDTWNGRIWGRIDCSTIETCSGKIPVTLAEISIGSIVGSLYDVSLINGFNIKLSVEVADKEGDGSHVCEKAECTYPILEECPEELQLKNGEGEVIACIESSTDESVAWFQEKCPNAFIVSEGDDVPATYSCDSNNFVISFL